MYFIFVFYSFTNYFPNYTIIHDSYMYNDESTISGLPTISTRLILVIIIFTACVHIPGLKILTALQVWSRTEYVQDE